VHEAPYIGVLVFQIDAFSFGAHTPNTLWLTLARILLVTEASLFAIQMGMTAGGSRRKPKSCSGW